MSAEAPQAALSIEQAPHLGSGASRAVLGTVSLKSRLGLSRNGGRYGSSAAPPALARTAFYLLSAGATATLLSLLYEIEGRDDIGVVASAVATYALAIVCLVGYDRLSGRSFQLISAGAVALVSLALYYGGPNRASTRCSTSGSRCSRRITSGPSLLACRPSPPESATPSRSPSTALRPRRSRGC